MDQAWHGQRLTDLGVGILAAARGLSAAVVAMTSPHIVAAAAALGNQIRTEDGVANACDLIEGALAS